jgi:hypothetical protein
VIVSVRSNLSTVRIVVTVLLCVLRPRQSRYATVRLFVSTRVLLLRHLVLFVAARSRAVKALLTRFSVKPRLWLLLSAIRPCRTLLLVLAACYVTLRAIASLAPALVTTFLALALVTVCLAILQAVTSVVVALFGAFNRAVQAIVSQRLLASNRLRRELSLIRTLRSTLALIIISRLALIRA